MQPKKSWKKEGYLKKCPDARLHVCMFPHTRGKRIMDRSCLSSEVPRDHLEVQSGGYSNSIFHALLAVYSLSEITSFLLLNWLICMLCHHWLPACCTSTGCPLLIGCNRTRAWTLSHQNRHKRQRVVGSQTHSSTQWAIEERKEAQDSPETAGGEILKDSHLEK